jgi:hypothetical protein
MIRKWLFYLFIVILASCSSRPSTAEYNYTYGDGPYNPETISFADTLDQEMVVRGAALFSSKCSSCHKISEDKLVGPGLKDITTRRSSYWIMNFISNPKPMIDVDTTLHKLVQLCLIEMPDVDLEEEEVRDIFEFFRYLDN